MFDKISTQRGPDASLANADSLCRKMKFFGKYDCVNVCMSEYDEYSRNKNKETNAKTKQK